MALLGEWQILIIKTGKIAMRIAVLEDDPYLRSLFEEIIERLGHTCETFSDGGKLFSYLQRETYDLLILDWNAPKMSGMEILAWLREKKEDWTPVIFVTSAAFESEIVAALQVGADDYISKPIGPAVVEARLAAFLRRLYRHEVDTTLQVGRFRFDGTRRAVYVDGREVKLTGKEYELAHKLFSRKGKMLTRDYLLSTIWGESYAEESRTLDTHISQIRLKLGLNPSNGVKLISVYGAGYRLESAGSA
ncbi:response regulator [Ralstonia pickettii]|uniref:Response regulator n=2 Tax=Ralstonia pickettii TaxID=329 RepID=A0A7X2HRI2_RALPI|nr:response regulator [Ralstonia pickettii]